MAATYSIFDGEIIESTRKADIYSVLSDLPNNTQKLITPRDVRDAFLSTWANATFKLTSTGTDEYIGVDSNNPIDRDVKKKILIGKRSVGNLDIMTDDLILSDTDIFLYNTKSDSATQSNTKIAFLAGTASSLFINAPYIEAVESNNSITLNIVNEQDSVNILSLNNRISINNISFPTLLENEADDLEGKILKYSGIYPYGKLIWSDIDITGTEIGSLSSETNIYGSTVSLNGYNLEFIDDRITSETIGGIPIGSSFSADSFVNYLGTESNWPITEVLRKLLYPYVSPVLQLSAINNITSTKYSEIGVTASIDFSYSITLYSRESSEYVSMFFLRTNGDLPEPQTWEIVDISAAPLIGIPGDYFSFTASHVTYSTTVGELDYGLMCCDIYPAPGYLNPATSSAGFSYSIIDSIEYVAPFITNMTQDDYNFTESDLYDLITDVNTYKIIQPLGESIQVFYTGTSSYIYFAYPYDYGELSIIKDPNGFIIHGTSSSSFTYSTGITPSSPLDYYNDYIIYKSVDLVTYEGVGYFEFIF